MFIQPVAEGETRRKQTIMFAHCRETHLPLVNFHPYPGSKQAESMKSADRGGSSRKKGRKKICSNPPGYIIGSVPFFPLINGSSRTRGLLLISFSIQWTEGYVCVCRKRINGLHEIIRRRSFAITTPSFCQSWFNVFAFLLIRSNNSICDNRRINAILKDVTRQSRYKNVHC